MQHLARTAVATAVAVLLVLVSATDVAATARADDGDGARYRPPVGGPIVDDWRPPGSAYGAGNRGIDLDASPGEAVRAAASGVVTFAGRVGARRHVVVLHDDGLRTSYSFLATTSVRRGDRVRAGDVVGTAAGAVHFGVRAGTTYVDPLLLLRDEGPPQVHLVAEDDREMASEAAERRGLLDQLGSVLGGAGRLVGDAGGAVLDLTTEIGWLAVRDRVLEAYDSYSTFMNGVRNLANALNVPQQQRAWDRRRARVVEDQAGCTPADVPTPVRPARGRIVLLVAGIGSSTGSGAVNDVDTEALGYDASYEFSYAGIGEDYDRTDTYGDIEAAGRLLREQLVELRRQHPGVTIDVIAHSQGGLVTRAGLSGADTFAPDMPAIGDVITLGTPHHGSELASMAAVAQLIPRVRDIARAVDEMTFGQTLIGATSAAQMAGGSSFIDRVGRRGLPAGTHVTSIAASGDLIVDDEMSAIDDATNVIVPVEGPLAHDRLPGSAEAQREMALALADMGPQCRDDGPARLADAIGTVDATPALADAIRAAIDGLPTPVDLSVHS